MDTPTIRFKGFTDAWKQCEFEDIAYRVSVSAAAENLPCVEYEDINAGQGTLNKNLFDKVSSKSGIVFEPGDILFGKLRPYLRNWLLPEFKGVAVGDWWVLRSDDIDSHFVYSLIQTDTYMTVANLSSGSKMPRSDWNLVSQSKFAIPTETKEQEQIGKFFADLDSAITLHQRKCDELQEVKKFFLQKMFPSENSDVPEIRFAGFTDAWKQCKLEDITSRITRKNHNLESELPLTISAQYGLIDQNEFFDKRIASRDVSEYYLVRQGEFAYNKSTSVDAPWGAIKRLDRYEKGVLSTLYIVFGIKDALNTNSDFLVAYYDTDKWYRGVKAIAAEGARNHGLLNIAPADFFETTVMIPKDIAEQKNIGEFFQKLDETITLHQRRLVFIKEHMRC